MTEKLRSLFEESLNQLLFGHSGAFIRENILDSDGPVRQALFNYVLAAPECDVHVSTESVLEHPKMSSFSRRLRLRTKALLFDYPDSAAASDRIPERPKKEGS